MRHDREMSFDQVARWLLEQPEHERTPEELIEQLAEQLCAAGLPLWRLATTLIAFDPVTLGTDLWWIRGQGSRRVQLDYDVLRLPHYTHSPVAHAIETGTELRCRLDLPDDQLPFALLRELKATGATDFFILPLWIGDALTSAHFRHVVRHRRTWISFASDAPDGFSDVQIEALRSLAPALAMRLALETSKVSARSLLRAYLGANAAERVLEGAFQRGSSQGIRAVIWYCDMRGFTSLSDAAPPAEVVSALDRYFDCVATPVEANGGEVLKFVGDAVLAIFQLDDGGARDACRRGVVAARQALENLAALRGEPGAPRLSCGIALHVGDVYYGNIGTRNRLDFTVIGAAVNEVCRVEGLTRSLGVDVLLTEPFVRAAGLEGARALGRHELKGVSGPRELFTLVEPG
jgi:adenylate cyclase